MFQIVSKILIVENNPEDGTLMPKRLEALFPNSRICCAENLQKGKYLIEKQSADVIFLDLALPEENSIEFFHALIVKQSPVPFIILTACKNADEALLTLEKEMQSQGLKERNTAYILAKSVEYGIERSKITEQKRNESEKEMLIEKLMLINHDLQQFSYITSHNLRAPLNNLLGLIKLFDISSVTDASNQILLENFEKCTYQLNETVNDLINILIIKNNEDTKKEKLDIRKTFEKVVQSVQTAINEKKILIITDFNNSYEVYFNRTYLESIFLNLVTNSVKYSSPDRLPAIKVTSEKTGDGIKIYFEDNGLGIDLQRNQHRIFGLYQRFHDNADSKGLGLYMVKSQIQAMGGDINVVSEVDKGTTFTITFKNQ